MNLCESCKKDPKSCDAGVTKTGVPKTSAIDSGDVIECDAFEAKDE